MADGTEKKATIELTWNQIVLLDRIMEMYEDDLIEEMEEQGIDYVYDDTSTVQLYNEYDDLKRAVKKRVYDKR